MGLPPRPSLQAYGAKLSKQGTPDRAGAHHGYGYGAATALATWLAIQFGNHPGGAAIGRYQTMRRLSRPDAAGYPVVILSRHTCREPRLVERKFDTAGGIFSRLVGEVNAV